MDDFPAGAGPSAPSLQAALLDYFSAPGKYQLSLRQPALLFASLREVLHIAAGRGAATQQDEGSDELREAAMFFIRAALLYPGADHYAVLGLSPEAEPRHLKERYRLLMRLIHPDFAASGPITWPADAATRVNRAYEVLSSPVLRRGYDEQLAAHNVAQRASAAKPVTHAPVLAARRPELRRRRAARQRAWTFGLIVAGATILMLSTRQEPTHLVQRGLAPAEERVAQARNEDELPPRTPPPPLQPPQPRHAAGPGAAPAPQHAAVAASMPPPHAPAVVAPVAPQAPAVVAAPRVPMPPPQAHPAPPPPRASAQAAQAAPTPAPGASVQVAQAAPLPAPRASVQAALPVPVPAPVTASAPLPAPKAAVAASSQPPPAPLPAVTNVPTPVPPSTPATIAGPAPAAQQATPVAVASPTLNDAQPVLTHLLQLLETGRGDQLLRLLEPNARNAPAAVELSRNFDLLVKGARPVRLSYVHFEGEPHDGVLLVTGRIRLYAGDPTIGATAQAFHVRAEFVSRGGKVKLIALSSAPD